MPVTNFCMPERGVRASGESSDDLQALLGSDARQRKAGLISMMNSDAVSVVLTDALSLDLQGHGLWLHDTFVPLPPIPFRILSYLVQHPRAVVSADSLLRVGWPDDLRGRDDLYPQVHYLRTLIEVDPHRPQLLVTRRNDGYYLRIPSRARVANSSIGPGE